MCSQTVRRFCILLRETFSNSIAFTLINKYAKGAKGLHLHSVGACLICCFSKSLQKRDFLDIYLTTVYGVRNSENTSALRVIFFLEI